MTLRNTTVALLAVLGLVACNVDSDGDGVFAQFDCDDTNPDINPDAEEVCDGLDNNCDNIVDNQTTDAPEFYADFDRDGFGDPDNTTTDCRYDEEAGGPDPDFEPFGYVRDNTDCDDLLKTVNPDADERCDGIDNNCDGDVDGEDAIDKATWFADTDGDGYGDAESTTEACDQPADFVGNDEDCNDSAEVSNPGADEICDSDDNDCDGDIDEDDAVDASAWYADMDDDGYGDAEDSLFACEAPEGYVADDADCNDEVDTANPEGTEVCDGFDNDCDSTTSEDGTVSLNATDTAYETIGAAISAATTGDTVYICAGTWNEQIDLVKGINIVGGGGSDKVIIDVEGADIGSPINIGSLDPVTIEGLTVRNGYAPGGENGGGIGAWIAGDVTLRDVVVEDCEGAGGGIVGPRDGTLTIEDSVIQNNVGTFYGGVLMLEGSISDTRILDNEAEVGGGLVVAEGAVTLTNTRIVSNYAEFGGGGIAVVEGGSVSGGTVLNNLSDEFGGGIWADGDVTDVEISGNRASDYGGGIYIADDDVIIDSCTVDGNKAPFGAGIASEEVSWTLTSTDVTNNEASSTGGGLWHDGGAVTIESSAIEGNSATAGGGMHLVSGTVSVTSSDWGTTADGNDNDPEDIFTNASETAYSSFGTGESFECDSGGDCL